MAAAHDSARSASRGGCRDVPRPATQTVPSVTAVTAARAARRASGGEAGRASKTHRANNPLAANAKPEPIRPPSTPRITLSAISMRVSWAPVAPSVRSSADSRKRWRRPAAPAPPKLKDEMRMPWQRGNRNFLRLWLVAGPFACGMETDCLSAQGGEAGIRPIDGLEQKRADGTSVKWHSQKSWGDTNAFDDLTGPKDGAVAYAFAKVSRAKAGKALLSVGSEDGIRVWLNSKLVLAKDGLRSLTPDEDQIEVDMDAGENTLLVKLFALKSFSARVLEPGTVVARTAEIGPSIVRFSPDGFTLKTDIGAERTGPEAVKIEVIQPGGKAVFNANASRGANVAIDAKAWPDGPYEVRCSTHTFTGRLYVAHLPWYKGDSLAKARELAATAAKADAAKPEGFTLKMLAEMVEDRLGSKLSEAKGNPWLKIHSPLMEFDEMMLERQGANRPHPPRWLRAPGLPGRSGRLAAVLPRLPAGGLRPGEEMAAGDPDARLQSGEPGLRAVVGRR